MTVFPANCIEFMSLHPDRYSTDAQPVECPLSPQMIEAGRWLVPAREMNKKRKTSLSHDQLLSRVDEQATSMHSMAGYRFSLQDAIQRFSPTNAAFEWDPIKQPRTVSPGTPKGSNELEEEEEDTQDCQGDEEERHDDPTDMEAKLKRMRKNLETAYGEGYSKAASAKRMARPATVHPIIRKRPSGSTSWSSTGELLKRPCSPHGPDDRPRQPLPVGAPFLPVYYRGCRIYNGGSRKMYRVWTPFLNRSLMSSGRRYPHR